ncbi:hypothetical protein SEPL_022 [Salmonella phage SE_PL]|uniref:hypothetical protein n=1 Tax=Salmonella enterica TaxID=28901 RepID=UPI0011633B34|nr:hypothetical protein [Salmonella enterica]ECV9083829.1 hypothetical protein [Salmonella enterica subsp. enterica serovar Infantis]MCP0435579.1 hypothetical protein [Salmonella enterica subsp. enterica serovar Mbandaka]QCW19110.1 hypothetical protein 7t3_0593 [Salmonella phage 7t3]QIG62635.1 hypothetical protein SEPL_022 [Salmonella phage SE_PL]
MMKSESVFNHPGGFGRSTEETRLVGFRVAISEIEKHKESWQITNPNLVVDLAIEYLRNNGYEVTKL